MYHLSASVGRLDVTICDCLPNIVSRHFFLFPHYSEKWRIPSDHRARFLEPDKEVLEAIVSISTIHLDLERWDARFRFVCQVVCPRIVPFSAQVMRCDNVYLLRVRSHREYWDEERTVHTRNLCSLAAQYI